MRLESFESDLGIGAAPQEASGCDRRRQVRLRLPGQALARIHIVRIGDVKPDLPPGLVELVDLSPGGCSFRSGLRLPVQRDAYYRFEWQMEGILLKMRGQIRWFREEENGYRYGVKFVSGAVETIMLVRLLNELVLKTCPRQDRIHGIYRAQLGRLLGR